MTAMCKVVALAAIVALAGCSGKPGASPATTPPGGGAASNAGAVQLIEQKLAADPAMKGAEVKVGLQAGTVTLDGKVQSVAQKDKAEQIVLQVQSEKKLQQGVFNMLTAPESGQAPSGAGNGGR